MIILKSFFHEDSLALINTYVYDHLVPSLNFGERPSLEVYQQLTNFISSTLDVFKQGQQLDTDQLIDLLDAKLPEFLPFMHDSPVTHVTPRTSEFPYEEFNSGKVTFVIKKFMIVRATLFQLDFITF